MMKSKFWLAWSSAFFMVAAGLFFHNILRGQYALAAFDGAFACVHAFVGVMAWKELP